MCMQMQLSAKLHVPVHANDWLATQACMSICDAGVQGMPYKLL